jgi:hypothetical protein
MVDGHKILHMLIDTSRMCYMEPFQNTKAEITQTCLLQMMETLDGCNVALRLVCAWNETFHIETVVHCLNACCTILKLLRK